MALDASDLLAPRPCRSEDLAALIGLLAVIEGELMTGEVTDHLAGRIRHRLETTRLLVPAGTARDLRQSINDLNHWLRYALGECDQPPSSIRVPD